MNRAYRRKQAKKINTPQKLEIVVGEAIKQREYELKKEYNAKIKDYIEIMIIMTAYTLHLEGYGHKRLPKVMHRILANIDSFRTGHLFPEDYDYIKKEVEEAGYKFED